jgi:hypothetical protein
MELNLQVIFGIIAGFFSIVCYIPYIISILKKKTIPSRATWITWTILSTVISFIHYFSGHLQTIWLPICGGIGQGIVALLSLKYGEKGWSKFDLSCLFCVGIGLVMWWHFNSPLPALILNILVDVFGALPTIKKTYFEPETEDLLTWTLYFIGSVFNLFAVSDFSFNSLVFPLYIFSVNAIMVTLVLRPRLQNMKSLMR